MRPESLQYRKFRQTETFNSLNGLRCISVLAVIWHHAVGHLFPTDTFLAEGYMGVDVFFAVSGFLITTLLLRERDTWGDIDLRSFYARRSLRIFPLYYGL